MKCRKCGGELQYANGKYICQSCGLQLSVGDYYEDIDTFICYVEYDSNGRRTKDSLIAQRIYNSLEAKKIKTFYSRISASDLSGDEFQRVCDAAISAAKTVIVFGTEKDHFVTLNERYSDFFSGKVVIPVYVDMDAYQIPPNISAIQALDYGRVGAEADLIKALLNALNRGEEVNYTAISLKNAKKKRAVILISGIFVVLVLCAGIFVALFAHKDDSPSVPGEPSSPAEDTAGDKNPALYDEAMGYLKNEEYEAAIKTFSKIQGYRDSADQLQLIYKKYAGYYENDDASINLHLQTLSGSTAAIEVTSFTDGLAVQIAESAQIQGNTVQVSFNDSENNQGTITVELKDKSIDLQVITDTKSSEIYIEDTKVSFLLDEKSDQPFREAIDKNLLLGFVENRTTMTDLSRRGFELTFISVLSTSPGFTSTNSSGYRINNTDIELAICNYDISKYNFLITSEMSYEENREAYENSRVDDPIVFVVTAPADIIIPERIGNQNDPFVENDILYVPDGDLGSESYLMGNPKFIDRKEITAETMVSFTSKELIGEKYFLDLVDSYLPAEPGENLFVNGYILPDSGSRYYAAEELSGLTPEELRLARNEVFARHGRRFDSEDLQAYFDSQPWYRGTIPASEFDDSVLNEIEKANLDLIKEIEAGN